MNKSSNHLIPKVISALVVTVAIALLIIFIDKNPDTAYDTGSTSNTSTQSTQQNDSTSTGTTQKTITPVTRTAPVPTSTVS